VNNEVLTVIRSGATSEGGFGSPGRLQEVDINHIDYVTCSDLYDGDIIDSVMLYAGVPGGGADSFQGDSGGPIFYRESTRLERLDRCDDLHAVEEPSYILWEQTNGNAGTLVTGQFSGSFSTEGGAVSKTAYIAFHEGAYIFQLAGMYNTETVSAADTVPAISTSGVSRRRSRNLRRGRAQ
jgi:hypothetical protein